MELTSRNNKPSTVDGLRNNMFFNNLVVYKFKDNEACQYKQEQLEMALQQDRFRACGSQDIQTLGWHKPFGKHGGSLSQFNSGYVLLCARKEEKIIPAKAINELVQIDVDAIEREESRPVKKKERDELKERILHQMLQQAFVSSSYQYGFIDMKNGYLIVNTASFNKAEEFAALLRKSIGTLPILPAFAGIDLDVHLTSWLNEAEAPKGFTLGGDADLEEPSDSTSQLKVKGHDLSSDEIKTHLDSGKRVTKVSLSWGERLDFVLHTDGAIKRLSYSDMLKEENADIPKEDMAVKLDADFLLGAAEITQLLSELFAMQESTENA